MADKSGGEPLRLELAGPGRRPSIDARIREMQAILRSVEWEGDQTSFACPVCKRDRSHGHDADCALKRALEPPIK